MNKGQRVLGKLQTQILHMKKAWKTTRMKKQYQRKREFVRRKRQCIFQRAKQIQMNYERKEWLDEVYVSCVSFMHNKLYIKKYEQSISSEFLLGIFETEFNITKNGLEFGVEF